MGAQRNVVVVGFDGSSSAEIAVLWAAAAAKRRKAELHVVQAWTIPFGDSGSLPMFTPALFEGARQATEVSLEHARQLVLEYDPQLAVSVSAPLMAPFAALREASEGARLTVVGSHGTGQVSEALLGSIALKVAGHLSDPVVVVHTDPLALPAESFVTEDGPVLVGLDGSDESDAALAFALEEASMRGVGVLAVHSWDDEPLGVFSKIMSADVDAEAIDQEESRLLAQQVAGHADRYPDVVLRQEIKRGKPSRVLLKAAIHYRPCLLVVGSRGRGGFAGLLLGSTSQELIAYAPCPVAVVRVPKTEEV
jgi:nucleotide-binding universal stress UspA family protein